MSLLRVARLGSFVRASLFARTGYGFLAGRSRGAKVRFLEGLLEGGRPERRGAAVRGLLRLADWDGSSEALVVLVRWWVVLDEDSRGAALRLGEGVWRGALGGVLSDPEHELRALGAALVGRVGVSALSGEVAASLIEEGAVGDAAERALTALAEGCAPGDGALSVARGVAAACAGFAEHRRRGVFDALFALLEREPRCADRSPELAAFLREAGSAGAMALRGRVRQDRAAEGVQRAVALLRHSAAAGGCADRLAGACRPSELAVLLRSWHLLAHPARRSALGLMDRGRATRSWRGWCERNGAASGGALPGAVLGLPGVARGRLGAWFGALPLHPAVRDELLTGLSGDGDPGARLRLAQLCARGWLVRGGAGLGSDADPRVRRCARLRRLCGAVQRARVRGGGEGGWLVGEDPNPARVGLEAKRLGIADRDGLVERVRSALRGGGDADAVAGVEGAVEAARRAGIVGLVEIELLALLRDSAMGVVSGGCGAERAALALGDIRTGSSLEALIATLAHPDEGVACAAARALLRRWRGGEGGDGEGVSAIEGALRSAMGDGRARVRGESVRAVALMHRGDAGAGGALLGMLSDERADHRIAGLRAVELLGARGALVGALDGDDVGARVAGLVRGGGEVGLWARRCAQRLLALGRSRERGVRVVGARGSAVGGRSAGG